MPGKFKSKMEKENKSLPLRIKDDSRTAEHADQHAQKGEFKKARKTIKDQKTRRAKGKKMSESHPSGNTGTKREGYSK